MLVEEGFDLAREHEVESLLAISNGYLGVRASLAEGSEFSAPATFVAGIFGVHPGEGSAPELVAGPDCTRLRLVAGGEEIRLESGEALEHRRVLDLRRGVLRREWRHRTPAGRITRIREVRLASLSDRHVILQMVELTPENYGAQVLVESRIEAAVPVPPLTTPPPDLVPLRLAAGPVADAGPPRLALRAQGTDAVIAFAVASTLWPRAAEGRVPEVEAAPGRVAERWEFAAEMGKTYRLVRMVAVHTSRDADAPAGAAAARAARLAAAGAERIVSAHVAAWNERWRAADVEIDGDDDAQRALRFACYHLIAAADPRDERVSIGARLLTGGVYKGHVFWDVEIYMLPFYVFTHPPAARALLMYRWHTLPAAREKARALGWRGALYAWESAATGEETTPPAVVAPDGEVVVIRNGEQENHISADVAYGVWQYWHATGDDGFLLDAGAEILIETARFWVSRVEPGGDGRYHIRHVIGPDEYHEDVDDNAYTNVMAQWNLERALEVVRLVRERWPERWRELERRLGVEPGEPESWGDIAAAMYTGFDPATGLFEQFRGYHALEEVDLAAYDLRSGPADVLLGRERTRRSKVLKQADVVLLMYLLWDRFTPEVRQANFRYYEPRCAHGSSLSPSIHALVAARLGEVEIARHYFRQAAQIDLANNMGNAAGGVHGAALGGLWQAAVFGFAGLHFGQNGPEVGPHLPPGWRGLRFPIRWRGRSMELRASAGPQQEVEA
ncbi:MAG TPA: glycosyl hydrolase family 65 protein [Longimicrobiales bacterium]